ncbi:ABC-2 type transport system permease protein [Enterococcus rotai]|uniref:ABC-2 type transporter domain-containing protein n=1 Tax=Enterococcus rotai TaxID=118060 RepID=A0A0U2XFJ7_9ENTE|nr:hypothetical protein [Enterococcus rotai]ALS36077.1 hypothetical protein ATZ35_02540 [Enterococcus rotai]
MIRLLFLQKKALIPKKNVLELLIFYLFNPILSLLFFISIINFSNISINITSYLIYFSIFDSICVVINGLVESIRFERYYRITELISVTPYNILKLMTVRSTIYICQALLKLIFSLIFIELIYPIDIYSIPMLQFLFTLLSLYFSITGFTMLIVTISLNIANINLFLNIILSLLKIFTGVQFSILLFPVSLQYFSRILPITNGIIFLNNLILQKGNSIAYILFEVLIGTIYFFLSFQSYKFFYSKSKINGGFIFSDT